MTEAAHRVACIPEILEEILLHTDICTLLTSAQRVSHYWNGLIKKSNDIQAALFFKPSGEKHRFGHSRIQNPLIKANLWPQYFRKRLHTQKRHPAYDTYQFPFLDAHREDAYLRKEASWRYMLTHQPPTSHMAVIETWGVDKESPTFTQLELRPKGGFFRLGHLDTAVDNNRFVAGQDPLLFWSNPNFLKRYERELREIQELASSTYLKDCEVVIFCDWFGLLERRPRRDNFSCWLETFANKAKLVHGRVQEPIWKD